MVSLNNVCIAKVFNFAAVYATTYQVENTLNEVKLYELFQNILVLFVRAPTDTSPNQNSTLRIRCAMTCLHFLIPHSAFQPKLKIEQT